MININRLKQILPLDYVTLFNDIIKYSLDKSLTVYTLKSEIVTHNNFAYIPGIIPVLIISHVDTALNTTSHILYTDNVISIDYDEIYPLQNDIRSDGFIHGYKYRINAFCLGGDDRCGVELMLEMMEEIPKQYQPHYLFTCGEEIGGIGAESFIACVKNNLHIPKFKYIMELDRAGYNDSVFYDCHNKAFRKKVNSYGFTTATGSFTDISLICPALNTAGVNLSVGYDFHHTEEEFIDILYMQETKNKIYKMIHNHKTFKYYSY